MYSGQEYTSLWISEYYERGTVRPDNINKKEVTNSKNMGIGIHMGNNTDHNSQKGLIDARG